MQYSENEMSGSILQWKLHARGQASWCQDILHMDSAKKLEEKWLNQLIDAAIQDMKDCYRTNYGNSF